MTRTTRRQAPQRRPAWPGRLALAATIAGTLATLAGCQSANRSSGIFEPYRVAVPQGNYLDQTMLEQVKPGMTPEQVRFALGSPLLTSVFHPDRWEYVFRFQFPDGTAITRRAAVFFREGRVERVEAEALPAREDPTDPALPGYRPAPRGARSA
jgi:outer membrane protein assembly factor BamE